MTEKLFVAWQGPDRSWHTIAQLSRLGSRYELVFTKGALPFEDIIRNLFKLQLGYRYRFSELIPLFRNRIPSASRPDFSRLSNWFETGDTKDEFELLAKFGLIPGTDSMLVYPSPTYTGGRFSVDFFVHGMKHMNPGVIPWSNVVQPGTRLLPLLDVQNEIDPNAVALRATDGNILLGYVPAFYAVVIAEILRQPENIDNTKVIVIRSNPHAPTQNRLYCRFEATLTMGLSLPKNEELIPLTRPTDDKQFKEIGIDPLSSAEDFQRPPTKNVS